MAWPEASGRPGGGRREEDEDETCLANFADSNQLCEGLGCGPRKVGTCRARVMAALLDL